MIDRALITASLTVALAIVNEHGLWQRAAAASDPSAMDAPVLRRRERCGNQWPKRPGAAWSWVAAVNWMLM